MTTHTDTTDPMHTARARAEIDHAFRGLIDAINEAKGNVLGNERAASITTTIEQLAHAVDEMGSGAQASEDAIERVRTVMTDLRRDVEFSAPETLVQGLPSDVMVATAEVLRVLPKVAKHTWDASQIPRMVRQTLDMAIERGKTDIGGTFTRAVLNNDLRGAILAGDVASIAALPAIVRYLDKGGRGA